MFDIKLYEPYYANSEPIPYKLKKGDVLLIKPILLKNYKQYEEILNILSIDKNELGSFEYIQMSYLEFLYNISQSEEMCYAVNNALIHLSELCFDYKKIAFSEDKGRKCLVLCDEEMTIEKVIKPKEFEDIKKIILSQNNPSYEDTEISQDMKQIIKEYYDLKYKNVNYPSLEQKKAFVCGKMGKTFGELNLIPIREFEDIYQSCVDSEMYIAQKIIQGSYKYEVKEDIKHPLFEKKKNPYEEVLNGKNDLSMLNGMENVGVGLD